MRRIALSSMFAIIVALAGCQTHRVNEEKTSLSATATIGELRVEGPEGKQAVDEACLSKWKERGVLDLSKPDLSGFHVKPGESYRSPIVSFVVSEAGDVSDVKLLRSSGIEWLDARILQFVEQQRYEPLPGCGSVHAEATVIVDFH